MCICVYVLGGTWGRVRQKVNDHNVFPVAPSAVLYCTAFKWVMREEFIHGPLSRPNACVNRMLFICANIFPNESKDDVQNQSPKLSCHFRSFKAIKH